MVLVSEMGSSVMSSVLITGKPRILTASVEISQQVDKVKVNRADVKGFEVEKSEKLGWLVKSRVQFVPSFLLSPVISPGEAPAGAIRKSPLVTLSGKSCVGGVKLPRAVAEITAASACIPTLIAQHAIEATVIDRIGTEDNACKATCLFIFYS